MSSKPDHKLQYQAINWQNTPKPTDSLKVRYTIFQEMLMGCLTLFFVLLTLLNISQMLRSPFTTTQDILIKGVLFSGFILALVLLFIFLMIRARMRAVRSFDVLGITRGDGRHFSWNDFQGVITRTARSRFGGMYNWRTELVFNGGESAWLIPQRVKNREEVFAYVAILPKAVDISPK